MDLNHYTDVIAFLKGRSVRANWTNEQRQYYRRTYTVDNKDVLRDIRTNLPVAVMDDLTRMIEKAHVSSTNEHRNKEETVAAMKSHYVPNLEQQVRNFIDKCSFCSLKEEKKAVTIELEKKTGLLAKRERYIALLQGNDATVDTKKSSDSDVKEQSTSNDKPRPSFLRSQSERGTLANQKKVRFEEKSDSLHLSLDNGTVDRAKAKEYTATNGISTLSRMTKSATSDPYEAPANRSRFLTLERPTKEDGKTENPEDKFNNDREIARLQAMIDRLTDVEKEKDKKIADYHVKLCDANMRLFSAEKKLQDEKEKHLSAVQKLNMELVKERGETLKAKQMNESLRAAHGQDKNKLERAQQDLNDQAERMRKIIKNHS